MKEAQTRTRRRKGKSVGGRPRKLSHEAILAAAEQLIRREGTDALTLRSLGAALDVQAPTLYTYFSNLEEIEEAALHRIYGSFPVPDLARPEPLAEQLLDMFLALRELHTRSPGALMGVPGSAAWHWEIRLVNQLLKTFSEIGVDDFGTIVAYRAMLGLTAIDAKAERTAEHDEEEAMLAKLPASEAGYIQRLFGNLPDWVRRPSEDRFRQTFTALVEKLLPQVIKHDAKRRPRR
ncbi:MAG TPA: helix-turn-helix domain-containing protein [Solimonas sp.]|nr:helix-turn-helix domain-containing protein [Solimonas sp.]